MYLENENVFLIMSKKDGLTLNVEKLRFENNCKVISFNCIFNTILNYLDFLNFFRFNLDNFRECNKHNRRCDVRTDCLTYPRYTKGFLKIIFC